VRARTERALALRDRIGGAVEIPGADASFHSYWVFAIQTRTPERTVESLRAQGFDATAVASLSVVPAPVGRESLDPREARQILARTVYVPVYPELPERELEAMADVLRGVARADEQRSSDDVHVTRMA
jgi:dTDP-4-amino-4,6-dideoxygalactose transaminase